ncbi:MAG: flagellar motor switch phosphatase FliY [Lachnospiraceae bacterium]|nr:flagellar motor switch phosphatase FliY [Lachnospiraceae bacterium]
MDGMLSQDEINALLAGMDVSEGNGNTDNDDSASTSPSTSSNAPADALTDVEKDAIGEVANISMGTSATTLYSLVNRKVNITTPVVTTETWEGVLRDYEKPCVFIEIQYTVGLEGSNILVLKEHDVKVITDLMMGGDGTNTDGELTELHLSAISEAMNQMMGSAATSLSSMLNETIDISPPNASLIDMGEFKEGGEIAPFLAETFVKIAFRMQIDDLVDSTIMQLYPLDFARSLYDTFIGQQTAAATTAPAPEPVQTAPPEPQPYVPPQAVPAMPDPSMNYANMGVQQMNMGMPQMQQNMGMQQMGMPQMQPNMGMQQMNMGMQPQMNMGMPQQNLNIQPAQFQSFSTDYKNVAGNENIGLIMDVPLEVTVELGRTKKSISDILDFAPGTIIELDRIAGEPIDVLVNGKFVAKGEVVVIEESFGIRITEIIK